MSTININIDAKVINPVYRPYLSDYHPTQIYYGGSSSGKSYFLAQRCIIDMLSGGHNYLIVRKVARTIRKSVFNEITKAISFFKVSSLFKVNSSELVITGPNGYQILFCGLDDVEKVKSITPSKGVLDTIWVEEATEADYEDIKQLHKRLRGKSMHVKRMVLSFNPIYKTHWLYKEYFAGHWMDDTKEYHDELTSILKTTYINNVFLTADDVAGLENEPDQYYKNVYTLGNWGTLGKAIFTNWETRDLSQQEFPSYCNAIDFGFAADPTAMVRVHYDRKTSTVYIKDARYCFGYTNDLIASEAKTMFGTELITCDSAEPKSIAELRQYGLTTTAAQKGKDSINFGIQWLQKMHIIIDSSLTEAVNEFTVYQWMQDKDGNVLPKPIDKNNHIIDAIRYGLERDMRWTAQESNNNVAWPKMGAM